MFIKVLPEHVPGYLETLSQSGLLSSFYMAGGTGLALQLGHRKSVDLDFFTREPFDPPGVAKRIASIGHFTVESISSGTLYGLFQDVKLSLFSYPYPLIKDLHHFKEIMIADPIDIGCMKIDAISSRGSRRDFIDLYFICRDVASLEEMFSFFEIKYRGIEFNKVHILKSLVYFRDAEQEPNPVLLKRVEWDEVKSFFIDQVKVISKQWV